MNRGWSFYVQTDPENVCIPLIKLTAFHSQLHALLSLNRAFIASFTQVRVFTETLVKTMVEPRRRCYPLPHVDLRKKVVGGVLSVTVVSASNLVGSSGINMKDSMSDRRQNSSGNSPPGSSGSRTLQTFIEVELGELTRRTDVCQGSSPRWDATFNMILHENVGILRFHLYNRGPSSVKYDFLTGCEIKV